MIKKLLYLILFSMGSFTIFPLSLLLISSTAIAQPDVITGGPDITGKFQRRKVNSDGSADSKIINNAYDHWNILNSGFQVTDIPGGTTVKSSLAIGVMDFPHIALMVTFAAADTDTVAFEIFVIAKQSTVVADGIDLILNMAGETDTTTTANLNGINGLFVANELGLKAYPTSMHSSRIYRLGKTNTGLLTKGTGGGASGTTTNCVFIPITTVTGQYISIPIIHLWVRNRKSAQLDDVTIDLWCSTGG